MPKTFFIYFIWYRNHFSGESLFSQVKAPRTKKTRSKIRLEWFCHHEDESLPSSLIQKGIMQNNNFWLWHTEISKINSKNMRGVYQLLEENQTLFIDILETDFSNHIFWSMQWAMIHMSDKTSHCIDICHLIYLVSSSKVCVFFQDNASWLF